MAPLRQVRRSEDHSSAILRKVRMNRGRRLAHRRELSIALVHQGARHLRESGLGLSWVGSPATRCRSKGIPWLPGVFQTHDGLDWWFD